MARTYSSWITGLRYPGPDGTNRQKYCCSLRSGTVVRLVREPENQYSDLAVGVKYQDRHLGYIPDRHAWIADAIDEGKILTCTVSRIETVGFFFPRAKYVGLSVSVDTPVREKAAVAASKPAKPKKDKAAEARRRSLENSARELCINGLRVLAHIALSDHDLSADELVIEAKYIDARLRARGVDHDSALVEYLLGMAQGLSVPQRGFVRALNAVVIDKENFSLVLKAVLDLFRLSVSPNQTEIAALTRIQAVGKAKGWL